MMGELWPMIIFTLLYWQLANKITKTEDAGRFYFFSNLFGQTNLLISGSIMIYFSRSAHFLLPWLGIHKRGVELTIAAFTIVVVGLGLLILFLHRYIEKYIMHRQMIQTETVGRAKLSLGLQESFKMIVRSKYLGLICLLMISYSMVINLTEALWFHYTSLFYQQDLSCFITFQGKILFWIGIFTLICSFLGTTVMRKLGWLGAALVTPIMTFVIGVSFFIFVVAKHFNFLLETIYGMPTIGIIVAVGGLQNILAKGAKYCFFDATKEMVYIPLDNERQTKGKAAVDIVGGKIGKFSGSILQVICYTIFSGYTPDQLSPFLMGMFFLICIIWITATCMLSKEYHKLLIKS
ncbi:hypothetical protein EDM02_01085 [Candidatus Cardinium hertigii]|nr:hypothetical protein EDM02_01085 [Candidatus Cardinium hertigii]